MVISRHIETVAFPRCVWICSVRGCFKTPKTCEVQEAALFPSIMLFPLHLKVAACIALGLAGVLFVLLLILLAVEAHQDHALNEIALLEERKKGGPN